MKELWTTNPFHLMNSPFAEMGYSSSEPNIVPAHLLLAIRTPLAAPPRTASASPLRATRRPPPRTIRSLPAQHPLTQTDALIPLCAQAVGITGGGLLVSALLTLCSPSACFPRNIRRLPASHLPASSPRNARRLSTNHLPTHGAASAVSLQHTAQHLVAPCKPSANATCTTIRRPPAQHPPSHRKPSAIALRTLWPPAQHPSSHGAASADPRASSAGTLQTSAGTNRCP